MHSSSNTLSLCQALVKSDGCERFEMNEAASCKERYTDGQGSGPRPRNASSTSKITNKKDILFMFSISLLTKATQEID